MAEKENLTQVDKKQVAPKPVSKDLPKVEEKPSTTVAQTDPKKKKKKKKKNKNKSNAEATSVNATQVTATPTPTILGAPPVKSEPKPATNPSGPGVAGTSGASEAQKKKKKKKNKKKNKSKETEAQATTTTTAATTTTTTSAASTTTATTAAPTTKTTSEVTKSDEKGKAPAPAAQVEVKQVEVKPVPPPEPTLLDFYRETVEKQTEKKIYDFYSKIFLTELKKSSSTAPKMDIITKNVSGLGAAVITASLCSINAGDLIQHIFASGNVSPTNYISTPNLILEQFEQTVDDYAYFYTFIRVPVSANAGEDITHRLSMIKDKDKYFIAQALDEKYGLEEQLKQRSKILNKVEALEFWKTVIAAVDKKEAWESITTIKNDLNFVGAQFPKRRRVFFFKQKFDKQTFLNALKAVV